MTDEIRTIVAKLRRQARELDCDYDLSITTPCGSYVDIMLRTGLIPTWNIHVNNQQVKYDLGFKTRTEAIDFIREQKTMIKLLTYRSF